MPNHNNRRGYGRNNYTEHDDRMETRRVSFKPSRHNQKGNFNRDTKIRALLEDEDIDMSGTSSGGGMGHAKFIKNNKSRNKRGGRIGSPVPNNRKNGGGGGGGGGGRRLFEGPTNWYKVEIPYGNKYDKDFLLKSFQNIITPVPLIPVLWRASGQNITFFVDDFKVAEKLYNANQTITCSDGFRLKIRVRHGLPQVDLGAQVKEAMKQAMARRYNPTTKALDLTKFHADPSLSDYFCALFKPAIMLAAIDIMAEHIPELEALNLEENRIQFLDHLRDIKKKLPMLKILYLKNNKIRNIANLDVFRGLPITELVLDLNPLCNYFRDKEHYISDVRKKFPKLVKLDGAELPPRVVFDLEEDIALPKAEQTYLCNGDGMNIIRTFVEQYFQVYDSDNRQPLLQAYHEHAMFSMTMAYPYGSSHKNSDQPLHWYQTDNRNLTRVQDPERRNRLLRQGQLAVVSFLSEMPKTKHDINSFTVDLTMYTSTFMLVSLSGVFRELSGSQKHPPIRAFYRTMLITPAGAGVNIVNEHLHITNATQAQNRAAFKPVTIQAPIVQQEAAPAPVPVSPATVSNPGMPQPVPNVPDDNTKRQMVEAMMQQSGMNFEFSTKCLNETSWDFQRALFIFSELQKQGTIPPEAFVK